MTNSGVKLADNVDESLIVMNDWSRISQVLASLLNNAVKFTSAGSIHFGFTTHHNIIVLCERHRNWYSDSFSGYHF